MNAGCWGGFLKKGYQAEFGSDPDAIDRLLKFGDNQTRRRNILRIGSDMRLIDVDICRQRILDYVKEYGDLVICDGTYGCEVYG